jgi:2-iminobutanoate/2-iminopropanoate deaminase
VVDVEPRFCESIKRGKEARTTESSAARTIARKSTRGHHRLPTSKARALAEQTEKKVISTSAAPAAIGPYSQAIRAGKTLYLAAQIAIDPKTNQVMSNGSIEEQTRRVLDNLSAVLAAEGLTMDHVASTTVFLKDVNEFAKVNEVYALQKKRLPPGLCEKFRRRANERLLSWSIQKHPDAAYEQEC